MKYLILAAAWMNLMYAEAMVEPGRLPGTYTIDQYGDSKMNQTPQKSFPKNPIPSRPSRPINRR